MDYFANFLVLAIIYFLFFDKKWRKRGFTQWVLHTTMYVYIVMVIYVTLMPISVPLGGTNRLFMETANFIPFRDVMLHYGGAVREVFLNILMMMPFGFLLPIIKKKGLLSTVSLTFLFSFLIETTQLFCVYLGISNQRTFDVTDLITNTFGGVLGYFVYFLISRMVKKVIIIRS